MSPRAADFVHGVATDSACARGIHQDVSRTESVTRSYANQFMKPLHIKLGPEFTFGIYMHKILKEPVLLIMDEWGARV